MRLEVFLLGTFEVRRDGVAVTAWPRAAARQLLRRLVLAPQQRLGVAPLAQALWPADFGDRVPQRLHHLVYLLRRTLDPAGQAPGLLRVADGGVALAPAALWVDALAFEAEALPALRAPLPEAAALQRALALYGGPLLPGELEDPEIQAHRERLERQQAELLHALAAARQREGAPAEAIRSLHTLLQRRPADERAHAALIALYGAAGRRAEVERQYAACKAALAAELGVPPSAATHQAYRSAMLGGEAAPLLAAPDAAALPTAAADAAADAAIVRLVPPAPLVPLIDRDALVQAVAGRLAEPATRLVTLVGPGGIGKTQLALRLGHELQGRYRHGVAFVSLAEVGPDGVADRLRRSLRLVEQAEAADLPPVQGLIDALRERHLLLVCDNGEHVAAGLGLLTELLMHCPHLTVLATSRRRLNLRAEQVVAVPPLAATAESGLRLFAERAAAAAPGFRLASEHLADVQAIVEQLGGLPLAIELVAARVPLLPPAALRQALAEGRRLVAGGGPDRPERHRSLQASLAWSRSLLSPLEREVHDRAALFVAPFDLPALAAVCRDLTADVTPAAQALRELGLLARAPGPADATGAAAAEPRWQRPLDDDEDAAPALPADAAARRFTEWFAGLAHRLAAALAGAADAQARAAVLAAFDADHENFFAALAQAHRLGEAAGLCEAVQGLTDYWARSGAWQRADRWVLLATEASAALPPAAQAVLLGAVGVYWHDSQRHERAREAAQQALALGRTLGDVRLQARATVRLASALYHLGEAEAAIAPLQPLADSLVNEADAALRRAALNNLGNAWLCAGELGPAQAAWHACDAEFDGAPVAARVPYLHNLALVAHYEGRHALAQQCSAQAETLELAGAARAQRLALVRLRRCWMACCRGAADEAAAALAAARDDVTRARLPGLLPLCAAHDGKIALLDGQAARAEALLRRALAQVRERGSAQTDPWDTLDAELWLIAARLALARPGEAPDAVGQALARLVTQFGRSWRLEQVRILEAAAAWLLRRGVADLAARAWQQAQAQRLSHRLPRFTIEQASARRTRAALDARLAPGWREQALAAAVDPSAPLAWLQPHLG